MALDVKHAFVSGKADGSDATQVQPSNWNASHALTATDGRLVGTSGSTTVGEITPAGNLDLSGGILTAKTRNRVINGAMWVNQRGASTALGATASGWGGCDRVWSWMDGTPTVHTLLHQSDAGGANSPVTGWYHTTNVTRTGGTVVQKLMFLEDIYVRDLYTRSKTFSARIKVYQNTGSAIDVYLILQTPDALNNFTARTTLTDALVSVPNATWTEIKLENVTATAAMLNGLALIGHFVVGAVTNKNFLMGEVTLEEGAKVTPFEPPAYADDLTACYRYMFHRGFGTANEVMMVGQAFSSTLVGFAINYPTMMRIAPAITWSGLQAANAAGGEITITTFTDSRKSVWGSQMTFAVASGLVAGNASTISGASTSAYLNFLSEFM